MKIVKKVDHKMLMNMTKGRAKIFSSFGRILPKPETQRRIQKQVALSGKGNVCQSVSRF